MTIRARRLALGLTGSALAKRVGVNAPRMSRIESGEEMPTTPIAVMLARIFKCEPEAVLTECRHAAVLRSGRKMRAQLAALKGQ